LCTFFGQAHSSAIEAYLRHHILRALLAALEVHRGALQVPALQALKLLICDAGLRQASLEQHAIRIILDGLRDQNSVDKAMQVLSKKAQDAARQEEAEAILLGLTLLQTYSSKGHTGHDHNRVQQQIACFGGHVVIEACMAAQPTRQDIQEAGNACLGACTQWMKNVETQRREVDDLSELSLQLHLALASGEECKQQAGQTTGSLSLMDYSNSAHQDSAQKPTSDGMEQSDSVVVVTASAAVSIDTQLGEHPQAALAEAEAEAAAKVQRAAAAKLAAAKAEALVLMHTLLDVGSILASTKSLAASVSDLSGIILAGGGRGYCV
jgi:hypothetical protein